MTIMSSSDLQTTEVTDLDLIDAVCMCHAALAQDSPHDERHYLNVVLNILFGYLSKDGRKEIDEYLTHDENVLAHKLCGAGNGGFFLTFSNKKTLTLPYDSVKINVVSEGVLGESV